MTGYNSKRNMAQAKLEDDDAQGYIAEYEAALLVAYQSGFADGKAAERKPLTDKENKTLIEWKEQGEAIMEQAGVGFWLGAWWADRPWRK